MAFYGKWDNKTWATSRSCKTAFCHHQPPSMSLLGYEIFSWWSHSSDEAQRNFHIITGAREHKKLWKLIKINCECRCSRTKSVRSSPPFAIWYLKILKYLSPPQSRHFSTPVPFFTLSTPCASLSVRRLAIPAMVIIFVLLWKDLRMSRIKAHAYYASVDTKLMVPLVALKILRIAISWSAVPVPVAERRKKNNLVWRIAGWWNRDVGMVFFGCDTNQSPRTLWPHQKLFIASSITSTSPRNVYALQAPGVAKRNIGVWRIIEWVGGIIIFHRYVKCNKRTLSFTTIPVRPEWRIVAWILIGPF